MRGYAATVIGGLALLLPTYVGLGKVLGSLMYRWADCVRLPNGSCSANEDTVAVLAMLGAWVLGAAAAALGSALAVRLTGSPGALATGMAAFAVWLIVLGSAWVWGSSGWPPWAEYVVALGIVVGTGLAARWLGLRWHERRGRAIHPLPSP